MIRFKTYFIALLAAAALAACGKDAQEIPGTQTQAESPAVFVLRGGSTPTTYGIATDDENEIDAGDVDLYMFEYAADRAGKFVRKFTPADFVYPDQADKSRFVIEEMQSYTATTKVFYAIANKSQIVAPAIDTNTTEAEFADRITSDLPCNGSGYIVPIATPLLYSGYTGETDLTADAEIEITLRRPVARFDIKHTSTSYEHFAINNIYISSAPLAGYIFVNAARASLPVTGYASVQKIAGPAQAVFTKPGANYTAPGVFYIYPTTIGAGGATTITLEGSYRDSSNNLITKLYTYTDASLQLKANHRYTINIVKANIGYRGRIRTAQQVRPHTRLVRRDRRPRLHPGVQYALRHSCDG